jgi:predicted CXXCH cytochrome family protein
MVHPRHALYAILLSVGLPGAALADDNFRYVATPVLAFEYQAQPDLRMPTAVTVAADGTVYVVDGVRDRILAFAPDGTFQTEITTVGERTLSRPVSAKVDRAGVLWIADTGNGRVVARAPDGRLVREIVCPKEDRATQAPDVTDVAVSADSRTVWMTDNHNDQLVQFDVASGTFRFVGAPGEALGQLFHPFLLAVDRSDDVLVSEPVNGRVQLFTAEGQVVGTLGTYGVSVGDLYRPKGLAVDADGNVWVADGTMGVVQIFAPLGNVLDVLRDTAGAPLKLGMPCGIALDTQGDLYVAELTANRVQKFTIQVNPQAPVQLAAPRPPPGSPLQPRACTVCHIEWMEPLSRGESTPLMAPPPASPEQPNVSRPDTCLSCHDGSAIDSRRLIWVEHGHRTGLEPPATMHVPPALPLVDGKVMCRTCHTAHGRWQGSGSMPTAIFLRTPDPAHELCVGCHANVAGGPENGMHPTGSMSFPVPDVLLKAGARTGTERRELTCQTCHRAHGAVHQYLLVLDTTSNQLCMACHGQMRPGMFVDTGQTPHPLSPVVDARQAAAIQQMGTLLGPGEHLICLSCHELHRARGQQFLLAENLTNGVMCLRCHADRQTVIGTPHDLRTNFPDERDRLGLTAHTGGPCSACHLFHEYARTWEDSTSDPGGRCITCHEPGRIAQAAPLGTVNHPPTGCTNCHDPHAEAYRPFLKNVPHAVCTSCHEEQAHLTDGPHDVACKPAAWPQVAAAKHDACLACHRPHGNDQTGLFRAGYAPGEERANGPCVACHPDVALNSDDARTLLHPRHRPPTTTAPSGSAGEPITCPTCHNPHRGRGTGVPPVAATPPLIRVPPQANPQELCFTCHADVVNIGVIGHAAPVLRTAGLDADVCGPCHVLHGLPDRVEPALMWPHRLSSAAESQPVRVANRYCAACHYADGPAPEPPIATHPTVDMFNSTPPDAPGYLPLFNDAGQVDPHGTISCRTCHLTHGRRTPAPIPPGLGAISTLEMRARAWHIRSLDTGSVCVTCHGFDALRRFMYFHNPARRAGPLVAPAGP